MSISNGKEILESELSNENKQNNKENIHSSKIDIYPKAKKYPKLHNIENKRKENEKEENIFKLNKEFLLALIQPIFLLDKQKMHRTISSLIKNSNFSKKIEKESETLENMNIIKTVLPQNLTYIQLEKDNILFHIGKVDDKFYFIIKGRVSELKAIKYNLQLTFEEYISYLINLMNNNENFLLNEELSENKNEVPINNIEEIPKIYSIIFKKKLIEKISLEKITNNIELEEFFKKYNQEFIDHKLSKKELKKLEKDRNKIIFGVVNREWDDYILENCHPDSDDLILFEPFESLYKDTHKTYICYKYEISQTYVEGDYFGDFSLDEDKIIRNETIRAEENTFLAWMSNEQYANLVAPSLRAEKKKEILMLNNSYFFKTISERIFFKNYYEMFVKKEYGMNTVLFKSGENPKSLIFLKQGKISLILKCSIIELNNLIKSIYVKLNKIAWPYDAFQKKILLKEDLKAIEKKYFSDSIFKKIKTFNKIFKMELEKKRKFQIALFSDIEIIGLEEIYLKMPYISKGIVDGDKIICHELPLEKFNIILQEEIRNITEWYVKASINRILSLMERLHTLKQNCINIAKIKSETAVVDNDILNINNSVDKNKAAFGRYKNKNNLNRLNINNSNTLIPQNISFKKNDDYLTKTENNDSEGNSLNYSKKNMSHKSSYLARRKNDRTKSKYKSISANPIIYNLKSANKIRNNRFELEKNELKIRAGSVKLSELLKRKKMKNLDKINSSKNDHIITIGNTKINLRKLRRKIKEYESVNELRRTFEEKEIKNNINDTKNNLDLLKDTDYIKIDEQNKNELPKEEFNDGTCDKETSVQKDNNFYTEKNNIANSIVSNQYFIKKNMYKSIDSRNNKVKKIHYSKLLINQIDFMHINSVNNSKIFFKKNKNEKININKKYITSNTNANNINLINQTSNSNSIMNTNNNTNNNTTISSILPKIQQKSKYTEYITKTNNFNSLNKFKKKTSTVTGRIPEIVKDYYSKIKKKGYIPLIANKESNTIFLRKYRRKYKDAEESQSKSLIKNEKILPKI